MNRIRLREPLRVYLAFILFSLACIKLLWDVGLLLLFEWQIPYTGDNTYFLTVGRGIVNGLAPYADLFETKPPGIFLLTALSIALTDSELLARIAQMLVIALFPLTIILPAQALLPQRRSVLWGSALLFGGIAAHYTGTYGGRLLTESFGALSAGLYIAVIVLRRERMTAFATVLAGVFLLGAVGFKEPFLLSCIAAALLLSPDRRTFLRTLILPLLAAWALGVLALQALGYLDEYFLLYLPQMLGSHVSRYGPLWLRGFIVGRHITHLSAYAAAFLIAVAFLWAAALATAVRAGNVKKMALVLLLFLSAMHGFLWFTGAFQTKAALSMMLTLGSFLLVTGSGHRLLQTEPAGTWKRLAAIALAFYLTTVAVGTGGEYLEHHFLFAVPVYGALFLLFLREHRGQRGTARGILLATLLLLTAFLHGSLPYGEQRLVAEEMIAVAKPTAQYMDDLLDRCGVDRYLLIGGNIFNSHAYTKHSPLGPGFSQHSYNIRRPFFAFRLIQNIKETAVIFTPVLEEYLFEEKSREADDYILEHFTEDPWECAEHLEKPSAFRVFFRKRRGEGKG